MATKKVQLNVPNVLTLSRLVLAPLFFYSLSHWSRNTSFMVLGIAFLTDATDGFFARLLKQGTPEGILIDSLADKVFAVWVAAGLLVNGLIAPFQLALLLTRDIFILFIGGTLHFFISKKDRLFIEHSMLSKAITGLQYVTIVMLLLNSAYTPLLIYALGILGIACAVDYTIKWRKAPQ